VARFQALLILLKVVFFIPDAWKRKKYVQKKNLKRQKFHRVILVGVIFVNDELGGFVEDGQSSSNLRK